MLIHTTYKAFKLILKSFPSRCERIIFKKCVFFNFHSYVSYDYQNMFK